jgi:dTMP kinase
MYLEEPLFIVVDGVDGCGKTTLINNLAQHLRVDLQQDVVIMRALGQGRIGMECRTRHLSSQTGPGYESMMLPVSLMEAYYDHVLPALAEKKCVLMDRWVASYFAYQVNGREDLYSKEIYETLFDANRTPMIRQPDIYFIGSVDKDVARSRLEARHGETNYLDKETDAFKDRVATGFKTFTQQQSNVIALDCNVSQELVFIRAKVHIEMYLEKQREARLITKRIQAQRKAEEARAQ